MNDKDMATLIRSQLKAAFALRSELTGAEVARNFQPRQQGASSGPIVYFFKVNTHRHGHPAKLDIWDLNTGTFVHGEKQLCEDTYQFSAWIPQDPANVTDLTESDILNMVSGIIQSDVVISAFKAEEVGILRVTEVRNPYIVDDRERFAAVPTFDVVLTHERLDVATLPAVVTYDANISRV